MGCSFKPAGILLVEGAFWENFVADDAIDAQAA
jgi:hypothetical protein